jgi:serine/threonine protein kinase
VPDGSRGFEVASRVGTTFGKYTVVSLLGRGGMGEVYEAYDNDKHRTVALKILADRFSGDPTFRARFQRESHAAAVLQEPHVIPIHDWGEIDGHLYIDMRLVRGRTLDELIVAGPLEPGRAVAIIAQIGAALDAAHAEGLMHRDIKPHNIIVTEAEFAYLVDFGIAEARGDSRLTLDGTPVGTVHYMAPERFTSNGSTPAVDVYALACVLYESLTGDSPFEQDSLENIVGAHLASPPPRPSLANARVPALFDAVIAKGMAKDPAERFDTAGELVRASQRAVGRGNRSTLVLPSDVAASVPPSPPVVKRRRSRLVPAVLASVAALLVVALGVTIGLLLQQQNTPAAPPTSTAPTVDGASLFMGSVLQQPSLEVRSGPSLSAPVILRLPYDSEVFIVCTEIGGVVEGPGAGNQASIQTPVWNKVRATREGADLGFVPDVWVDTGTAEPRADSC